MNMLQNHPQYINAAVAIVSVGEKDPEYLLLQRAANPKDPWSGHVAFPGGRLESHDENLMATCIREAREECGINLQKSQLVQSLSPSLAGNHLGKSTWVAPFAFHLLQKPVLQLDPREVAQAFWVPRSFLLDSRNHRSGPILADYPERQFPYLPLEKARLWGFTYKVILEYLGGKI